ncbi:early nodulin-75 [Manihot esculenta]|uniref:Uncharacterized protein n=1 Tax=Manihot esculenta TaxID=3983 RepID=A0A2C9WA73_MANES|nr:early nodulin-75 [Manihot esculenta]OAY55578.1 hypothetical protein MANES_03G164801v8 [Manihot esculenta]
MSPKYLLVLFLAVVLLITHSLAQYRPPINPPPIYKPPPAEGYASVEPTDKHHGPPKKWPPSSVDGTIGVGDHQEKAIPDKDKPYKRKGVPPPHKPGHPPVVDTEDAIHRPPAKKKPPPYSHRPPSSD